MADVRPKKMADVLTNKVDVSDVKELEVVVRDIQVDDVKFKAYKTYQKNGRAIDLKFPNDVANKPKENCIIVVKIENMNLQTNTKYPRLWVKQIEEIKPLSRPKNNTEELNDLF